MDIKVNCYGWNNFAAIDHDTYDGAEDSKQNQVGYGNSEQDAIADLLEQMDESRFIYDIDLDGEEPDAVIYNVGEKAYNSPSTCLWFVPGT